MTGTATLWMAVLADMGASLIVIGKSVCVGSSSWFVVLGSGSRFTGSGFTVHCQVHNFGGAPLPNPELRTVNREATNREPAYAFLFEGDTYRQTRPTLA